MFKTDLVATKNQSCSLWIDLTDYPMRSEGTISDLGLSEEQLIFATANIITDKYDNTVTTLFYKFCSMRIVNFVPKTFAKVLTAKYPYVAMEPQHEDVFDLPMLSVFDVFSYRTLLPTAVVVEFSQMQPRGERITVYRNLTNGKRMVQYRTRGDVAFPLFQRLELLGRHSDSVLITNSTLRDMLDIQS